jgi:hypothetical protein
MRQIARLTRPFLFHANSLQITGSSCDDSYIFIFISFLPHVAETLLSLSWHPRV